ncbi:MAG TPA: Flp pilus assembly protein CpaB [Pirellulales bacterium]|jgi:pilus assembly protein CpaB
MRPKSLLLLALALACGLIAAIGINQVMANRSLQPEAEHGEMTPIFIALRDVGLGDPLTPLVLKLEEWPKSKVPPGAMTKLEDIEGRRARTKFFAGEPIIDGKLFAKGEQGSGATDLIPRGMRVVVVKVDDVSGSGLILPGDRVDVLVHLQDHAGDMSANTRTSTRTFLHNIKIFAVNNVYSRESNGETVITAKTISLLVTPQQAELVTMASEMGRIRLVMRSADDETESESTGVTPHQLLGDSEDGPVEPLPAFGKAPIAAPAAAPPIAAPAGPDMKNAWKMLMIEGDSVREIEFEDGTRMGSPTQIRQIHQGHRDGGAGAMPLPAAMPLPPAAPLPDLPPISVDTDPPPVDTPPGNN